MNLLSEVLAMREEDFSLKVIRLIEETDAAAVADGHNLSWFELMSAVYEKLYGESVPLFAFDLSEEVKGNVIFECFARQKVISELTEVEFLQLQYECQFGESGDFIGDYCSPIHTEEQLVTALRDCLAKGKPYELPEDVRRLMEQGVEF